jgi:hypothetical protein
VFAGSGVSAEVGRREPLKQFDGPVEIGPLLRPTSASIAWARYGHAGLSGHGYELRLAMASSMVIASRSAATSWVRM